MIVVSDTTAISSLILINRINLLNQLFGEVIIPYEVYKELQQGEFEIKLEEIIAQSTFIKVHQVSDRLALASLLSQLDIGEAAAIILAKEMNATLLIIDERKGYQIANTYGVSCVGTLGVLIEAYKKGLVIDFPLILNDLKTKAKFWISPSLEKRILELAREKE